MPDSRQPDPLYPDSLYAVRLGRDVLGVTGAEAESYLQGQLSQDLAGLAAGRSVWSWLLAPNGKVDALLRVSRRPDGDWLIDTDAGWGEAVLARLQRFKLRTKVDLSLQAMTVTGLRGPGWEKLLPEAVMVCPPWPGVAGADVISDGPLDLDVPVLADEEYEAERIRAGRPRMGAELDERTIPAETGLVPLTVSFTKGCYTGQELVARIDSRGSNVARRLRGLRFPDAAPAATPGPAPADPGAELTGPGGAVAGVVTSVAYSAGSGQWVGLGYVRRGIDLSEPLTAGRSTAEQVELSF